MNWLFLFINISFILAFFIIVLLYRVISYQRQLHIIEQEKKHLKKQSLELETLLNDSKILFFKHDIAGTITYINNAAQVHLGLHPEAVKGVPFQTFMCFKKGVSWDNYIQHVFREKEAEGIFYLKNVDSEVITFAYKCSGIVEEDLMVGVNGYARRVETVKPNPQKPIPEESHLKRELWQSRQKYKDMAHNLKNIFAAVLGFSDMIKEENLSKQDIQNYNAEIAAAGKHGIDILAEWLDSPDMEESETVRTEFRDLGHPRGQKHKPVLKKGKGRIMYVDDDKALLLMYKRFLERLGYAVDGFSSAKEALIAFEQDVKKYDLVMTDWLMPEVSGGELAEKIKHRNGAVPVIVLSGKSITEKINFDIFSILEKPVDPVKMSNILAEAFESIAAKS